MGVRKESISKFLIGNRFHVKLRILSPYSNRISSSYWSDKNFWLFRISLISSVSWTRVLLSSTRVFDILSSLPLMFLTSTFVKSTECPCGKFVDRLGLHGLPCIKNAGRFPRHSAINSILKRSLILLRPVAQLDGQVRTDWNQCFGIDCSLSRPAGHKPFTCSHSVVCNT